MSVIWFRNTVQNFVSFVGVSRFSEGFFGGNRFVISVSEKEKGWVSLLENFLNSSIREWHNSGEGVTINKFFKTGGVEFSFEIVSSFIEFFEQNDALYVGVQGASGFGNKGVTEG